MAPEAQRRVAAGALQPEQRALAQRPERAGGSRSRPRPLRLERPGSAAICMRRRLRRRQAPLRLRLHATDGARLVRAGQRAHAGGGRRVQIGAVRAPGHVHGQLAAGGRRGRERGPRWPAAAAGPGR